MTLRTDLALGDFVRESNRIEGITRSPKQREIDAHAAFISLTVIEIEDVVKLVGVLQPDARFRDNQGVPGVRVGGHVAPSSGPAIRARLDDILHVLMVNPAPHAAFHTHRVYERLHPFTDGNGRSGRALWLWQCSRDPRWSRAAQELGFLHTFYYQTLAADSERP